MVLQVRQVWQQPFASGIREIVMSEALVNEKQEGIPILESWCLIVCGSADAPGLAASFLALAEENGLPHLLAVSLDFILHQFPAVVS